VTLVNIILKYFGQVIGRDRRVQADDRDKTPYTTATVTELLRLRAPGTHNMAVG
jgi:cytochrome P450